MAVRQRELATGCDPAQLAFELHAFVQEANWARELLDEEHAFDRARTAIAARLRSAARLAARKATRAPRRKQRKPSAKERRR